MKKLNDLLKYILVFAKDNTGNYDGLCAIVIHLWFTNRLIKGEYDILMKYIEDNKPFNAYFRRDNYYWRTYYMKPRIKWLLKHIEKTK